jgi:serine/threonine protein kinase
MGVVYRASQTAPVRREVALKVLKRGMDTEAVVARFASERQTLAMLEHPSIAKVYDAGVTADGRPFFAMELVRGVPITDYADEHRLPVRRRVELLVQVCRAVQHAHQKGVIHRDLKPSNVLICESDDRPLAKIIDFGIARATEASDEGARLTRHDEAVGTPAYMSPEQVEGGTYDVDTRSDIYSLGVLLYELLVGALPYEPEAYRGVAGVLSSITREPPPPVARLAQMPPERRRALAELRSTDEKGHRRRLRGEVSWIAFRAMEKERDRRYETANGLALDLERYLKNQPVTAGPPSRSYQARKFVRRHRAGVAFVVVLVALLIGFAAVQTVQAQRIRAARDLAEARRTQAEGLVDFMLGDLRAKLSPIGKVDILEDVGRQAMKYFAALPESEFSDDELLSRSQALYQIGDVQLTKGNAAEATAAFRESLRLAAALSARSPNDPKRLFGLAQSHYWVGYAAWRQQRLDAAEREFDAYLALANRLVALDPKSLDYRLEVGYAESNLGSVREARGDLSGAIAAYSRTLAIKTDLVQRKPDQLEWLGELAETHNTLGLAYTKAGRYADGLREHRRELQIKTRLLALDPAQAYWRFRLALGHMFVGRLEDFTGNSEAALRSDRAAVAILDSLSAFDPANARWRQEVAGARRALGGTLGRLGRRVESEASHRRAIEQLEELASTDSATLDRRYQLGLAHIAFARTLLAFSEPATALREAQAARSLLRIGPGDARRLAVARLDAETLLGRALLALGRRDEGERVLRAAIAAERPRGREEAAAELRPLTAEAYLALDALPDARRELRLLALQGYRERFLMELAREKGVR